MTKSRVSMGSRVWASAFVIAMISFAPAQTTRPRNPPQEMLDFLAKPAPAAGGMSLPSTFPGRFADWTEVQKKSGLQLVVQHCALFNALEHDNPAARILPEPMTKLEEAELAVSICLPAKLPSDWPERRKYLENAKRLIARANSYGGALQLPLDLVQN